jgi:REP element-mobilizing transposase RayT
VARKGRVEFAGAVYHLLDRGDRREAIFRDQTDHRGFLNTLGEACERTGWRVHAFVLMSNHYHLLVETPQANLIAGMRWFQTTWTARFNRRHGLCGHLFQGRYKAVVVDPDQRDYFAHLSDYIHLNPVRAGIVSLEQRLFDYRWSSYPLYAAKERAGERLSRRKEVDAGMQRSHDEQEATGMLCASVEHYGMTKEHLRSLKKNDPRKLAIARVIRRHTAVANGWISKELGLGHVSAVSRCLKTDAALGTAEATLLLAIQERVFRNQPR